MFVVLYRWRIKPGFEKQFVENWSVRTAYLREKYDSLGSRLHRGDDGIWYSYAQWKSSEQRTQAFTAEANTNSEAGRKIKEATKEYLPEIQLEMVSDFLILPAQH